MSTSETAFHLEEIAEGDAYEDRPGLPPEVELSVQYMRPGDELAVLDMLDAVVARARHHIGRSAAADSQYRSGSPE